MSPPVDGFSFLVLAYNHEEYILEHLESIKYLVEEYGSEIKCNLIINDDCSKDETVFVIESWLSRNSYIFSSVVKLYNKVNLGTCESILNMLEHVATKFLKLTAGDDVYSFENIFAYASLPPEISIRSGIPLDLTDGVISEKKIDTFNIILSDLVYKNSPLIDRFRFLSNNNAPNIIYNFRYLNSQQVKRFLGRFDVVEDWPLQVAIGEFYSETRFDLVGKVFVYYRRTLGSTYIVAGSRFYDDKCKLYKYLIEGEPGFFRRMLLVNRFLCFKSASRVLNKLCNGSFYFYIFSVVKKLPGFYLMRRQVDLKLSLHKQHYLLISERANLFSISAKKG